MLRKSIGFILISVFSVFLSLKSGLFNIKKIEVFVSKNLTCASVDQLKDSSKLLGQNLFLINNENLVKEITEKFICVKNINLSKFFPSQVKISVFGREPAVILTALKDKEATLSAFLESIATPSADILLDSYLVDNDGIIFSKDINNLDIPRVFLFEPDLSLGKKLESDITSSLKILDKVKTFGLDTKTAIILDNFFIIFSHPKLVFRLDNKVDAQIASLQVILAIAKINSQELEFIDLRFDKPIVKIAPKKNG